MKVSYTNELERDAALQHLASWLDQKPEFAAIAAGAGAKSSHASVIQRFIAAAEAMPEDASLHNVLGVLFNQTHEYDKAADAFRRALALQVSLRIKFQLCAYFLMTARR